MFTDGHTYGQTDRRTDARLIAISAEPFGREIKKYKKGKNRCLVFLNSLFLFCSVLLSL